MQFYFTMNADDEVVGAVFEGGKIDETSLDMYALIEYKGTTAKVFQFAVDEMEDDEAEDFAAILAQETPIYISGGTPEKIVIFDKQGDVSYNELIDIWDEYCIAVIQNFDEEGEPR